jgi:hypothetical protein
MARFVLFEIEGHPAPTKPWFQSQADADQSMDVQADSQARKRQQQIAIAQKRACSTVKKTGKTGEVAGMPRASVKARQQAQLAHEKASRAGAHLDRPGFLPDDTRFT